MVEGPQEVAAAAEGIEFNVRELSTFALTAAVE
jgi:hypothetical protein